jgi:hypothetical protein
MEMVDRGEARRPQRRERASAAIATVTVDEDGAAAVEAVERAHVKPRPDERCVDCPREMSREVVGHRANVDREQVALPEKSHRLSRTHIHDEVCIVPIAEEPTIPAMFVKIPCPTEESESEDYAVEEKHSPLFSWKEKDGAREYTPLHRLD